MSSAPDPAPPSTPVRKRARAFGAVALVVTASLLTACGGPANTDPRKGRVYMHDGSGLTGDGVFDWKACIGPDLLIHFDGAGNHTLHNSPECAS